MKITSVTFGLLSVPAVIAESTKTATASTTTSTASSCSASLITKLCEYKEPGPEFAVASSGQNHCLEYCNDHPPCNFVIFAAGNPNTGTGTCWLYPDEDFYESAGNSDCGNPTLSVFDKPDCEGEGSPTTTEGACAATASPSSIAMACDYPPPGDCFEGCTASESATNCLSQCVEADACNFVVFNPHNPSNSPYASGTCWIYSNSTYDDTAGKDCENDPEQYMYENPCPKPSPSKGPTAASTTASNTVSANGSSTGSEKSDETADAAKADDDDSGATASTFISPLIAGLALLLW